MSVAELARVVGGRVVGAGTAAVTGAEVDSRRLRPGDLFVALPGDKRDGHEFVAEALETAAAALVRRDVELAQAPAGRALICVDDPLTAYHHLAAVERERRTWKVVGVTGSLGKTTSKEFLAALLATGYVAGASEGNRNSTLGLPAQLIRQPEEVEVFVAEMGMSHAGELDLLGRITRPDVVLYTRLAPAHTEFFPDMAAMVRAKGELLGHLRAGGTLVLNADDPNQDGYAAPGAEVLRYGSEDAPVRLENLEDRGLFGTRFELVIAEERRQVELGPPGAHQAENLVAAAAAAWSLDIGIDAIAEAAAHLEAPARRGRILRPASGVVVVDDSYNASPLAMERILGFLRSAPGRRVAVLGEMYELGGLAAQAHERVGRQAASACDVLVAVGDENADLLAAAARRAGLREDCVFLAPGAEAAAFLLERLLEPGDVVLIKGSRGVGLDRTVDALVGREAA